MVPGLRMLHTGELVPLPATVPIDVGLVMRGAMRRELARQDIAYVEHKGLIESVFRVTLVTMSQARWLVDLLKRMNDD